MRLRMLGSASGKDARREAALSRTSCKYSFEKAVKTSIHTITKKHTPTAALILPYKVGTNCHLEAINHPKEISEKNILEQKLGV